MYGTPVEITPVEDLLVWGGLAFLVVLCLLASIVPRFLNRRERRPSAKPAREARRSGSGLVPSAPATLGRKSLPAGG